MAPTHGPSRTSWPRASASARRPTNSTRRGRTGACRRSCRGKLRAAGYQPFIDTIRGCVRHSGGLRIDHVMGLFRLFWIPDGMAAKDGAYVREPRARPPGDRRDREPARPRGDRRRGSRDGRGRHPRRADAPEGPVVPPALVREGLAEEVSRSRRLPRSRRTTCRRLRGSGPVPTSPPSGSSGWRRTRRARARSSAGSSGWRRCRREHRSSRAIARIHEALASAPSRIITATLEDAIGVEERPNMPATTNEWPNWSIALPMPLESLEKNASAARLARILARGRPRPKRPRRQQTRTAR